MGGLAGHMMHPHDNKNLTIGQFKALVKDSIEGRKAFKEKLDGFNIHIGKADGHLFFARNGKDLQQGGFYLSEMDERFSSEEVRNIYKEAWKMLIVDQDLLDGMIDNLDANVTYNCEIIFGQTNVLDYPEVKQIIIHNAFIWRMDSDCKYYVHKVTEDLLENLPQRYLQDELSYNPGYLTAELVLSDIDKCTGSYGMTENNTLNHYYEARFVRCISLWYPELLKTPKIIHPLYERIMNRNIIVKLNVLRDMTKVDLDEVLSKENTQQIYDFVRADLERIVLKVGTEILNGVHGYLNEPYKYGVINDLALRMNVKFSERLEAKWVICDHQIYALEGVVFKHEGELYKWTGPFAPINQILGGRR